MSALSFMGIASFQTNSALGTVSITIPEIINNSSPGTSSSTVQVELWFFNAPYSARTHPFLLADKGQTAPWDGTAVAAVTNYNGTLSGGGTYDAQTVTVPYHFDSVFNGNRYAALLLKEGPFGSTDSYINFPSPVVISGFRALDVGESSDSGVSPISLSGASTQYDIADDDGKIYIRDLVPGRDDMQDLPAGTQINFTDGTGVFDPNGNAEEVARLYQAALGRAPDVGGLDGWTAQLNAHNLGIDGVALGFISSAEFSSKYGTLNNADFVTKLYQNVLHRAPDSGGEQGWINQLNGGMSRARVLIGFSDSFENKQNTRATMGDRNTGEAYRLYQAALNRTPENAGLRGWTEQLDNGMSPFQVAQGFVSSNEFAQLFAGLNTKGFVDQLYQNVLHRAPDSAGEQGWINQINSGVSKAQVVLGFSDSLENRLNTSQATHDSWVFVRS